MMVMNRAVGNNRVADFLQADLLGCHMVLRVVDCRRFDPVDNTLCS